MSEKKIDPSEDEILAMCRTIRAGGEVNGVQFEPWPERTYRKRARGLTRDNPSTIGLDRHANQHVTVELVNEDFIREIAAEVRLGSASYGE